VGFLSLPEASVETGVQVLRSSDVSMLDAAGCVAVQWTAIDLTLTRRPRSTVALPVAASSGAQTVASLPSTA
jgi:hypothetical protein